MTDALAPKPEDLSIDAPPAVRAQLTHRTIREFTDQPVSCLLYTSDAADE